MRKIMAKHGVIKQEINNNEMISKEHKGKEDTKEKVRDYQFDNLKAILIILVVWGHILTSMRNEHDIIRGIYIFIFFFHMPAMVFISGYFSKNLEKIRNNAFVTILLPYLILNIINYAFKILLLKEKYSGVRLFNPTWGLWYLLTLFLWKFFLRDLVKIRYVLPLSLVVALMSGYTKEFSDYMALGRFLGFLPFFLAGYYCTTEHVARIRKVPKIFAVLMMLLVGAWSYIVASKDIFDIEVLFLRTYYPKGEELQTLFFRFTVYIVAAVMTFVLLNLVSKGKSFLTNIGASTMTVYVLHLFTIPLLEKLHILENHPIYYLIYSVLMTVVITYVYSQPAVKRAYDIVMDKLSGLVIKREEL
jgi:fucose 4-O-acetylase-like acetyltransferase